MSGRKKIARLFAACCIALSCLLNSASAAPKPEEKPPEKGYVREYALVGLGIVLGLLGVCRPRNRDKQPTFKDEDQ